MGTAGRSCGPPEAGASAKPGRRPRLWLLREVWAVNGRHLLTVNAGSSSLKVALYRAGEKETRLVAAQAERIGSPGGRLRLEDLRGGTLEERSEAMPDHPAALRVLLDQLRIYGWDREGEPGGRRDRPRLAGPETDTLAPPGLRDARAAAAHPLLQAEVRRADGRPRGRGDPREAATLPLGAGRLDRAVWGPTPSRETA